MTPKARERNQDSSGAHSTLTKPSSSAVVAKVAHTLLRYLLWAITLAGSVLLLFHLRETYLVLSSRLAGGDTEVARVYLFVDKLAVILLGVLALVYAIGGESYLTEAGTVRALAGRFGTLFGPLPIVYSTSALVRAAVQIAGMPPAVDIVVFLGSVAVGVGLLRLGRIIPDGQPVA